MHVVIAGATGLIGRALCPALAQAGHTASALTRNPSGAPPALGEAASLVEWDPRVAGPWEDVVSRADAVINLSGENIGGRRWNDEVKRRLRSSRLDTTRALVRARASGGVRGGVFVNASGVGYYGDCGEAPVTEARQPSHDFLGQLCVDWEGEALAARELGMRVVLMRTSLVLSREGGAMDRMIQPFRLFLGGSMGSGRQWTPWIHIADTVRLYVHALESAAFEGPVNVAAPNPVRNRDFAAALAIVLKRPSLVPAPRLAMRLVVGEFADALLASQRVVPKAAQDAGYEWRYPVLEPALHSVVG
jgi:uncharacterized protein (TIGR01777 family)